MPATTLTTSDPPSTAPSEGANTPHLAVRAKQATGLRADRPPRSGLGRNGVPSLRRFPTLALLASLVAASAFTAPPSLALTNPERHYEMVSPPYKGGYGVGTIDAVSPDGDSVAFFSNGAFAGAPSGFTDPDYVARRGAAEWSTAPVMPPASLLPYTAGMDVSPSLSSVLAYGKSGPDEETAFQEGTEEQLLLHDPAAADTPSGWEPIGETMKALDGGDVSVALAGASADFCHVVLFASNANLLPVASEAANPRYPVYDMARGCAGEPPGLHVVGLNNSGTLLGPACYENLGPRAQPDSYFNAISAGGRMVFFSGSPTATCNSNQLFLRLGASRTLEVSKPAGEACQAGSGPQGEVPCEGAASRAEPVFVGASRDGSRVFFTTTAQLAPGEDSDGGNDLYMASIGCPAGEGEVCASPGEVANAEVRSVVQVSHDVNVGEAAEVQGAVRVAPDGSRAYFVARGVLGEGSNPEGRLPVKGADNLYVYDSRSGKTVFVAELCSGPGVSGPGGSLQSGAVEDIACPSDLTSSQGQGRNDALLWNDPTREVQTAGSDGRFLVFATYARLIASGPQADTDDAKDVYRYDAATGALSRISLGEAGAGANGNANGSDATIAPAQLAALKLSEQSELGSRAASEDGSRLVFTTAQALSPSAINDAANAYEWHETARDEGAVSLISPGAGEPISQVVISPAGNDVFFRSSQSLLAQDTDSAPDIYDARIGPDFPPAPAARQECSGDACQGPLTNPAALLIPGSVSQAPGENVLAPPFTSVKPGRSTTAQKLAAARRACRKKHNRRKRALCERSARKRYGARRSAKNGSHR
jgi:hypothetical protein